MKANELRIGNYLQDQNGNFLLVIHISTESIQTTVLDRSKYPLPDGWQMEPIPLTHEILEKCGFVKRRDREYLYSIDLHKHISIVDGKDRFLAMLLQDAEFSGGELSVFCCNEIKYLHQLQNLIFSISGEELEVKL